MNANTGVAVNTAGITVAGMNVFLSISSLFFSEASLFTWGDDGGEDNHDEIRTDVGVPSGVLKATTA